MHVEDRHGEHPPADSREGQVYRQLARVYDPELDRPLTELGFIAGVGIHGGTVTVEFRLPTFWCAANFAYMMAAGIREQVLALPWVERVEVRLRDHFFADEINRGINQGLSFRDAFPDLATGDLEELWEAFRVKAFLRRQERLIRWLLDQGWDESAILGLRMADLERLDGADPAATGEGGHGTGTGSGSAPPGADVARQYLEALRERGLLRSPDAPALVDPGGAPIRREDFPSYRRHAARTRLAMEFNTAFCRGLLETRYGDSPSGELGRPAPGE
ncbi:MAG: hypothetical protein DIU69_02620 [Bacillota bacterium]|nr:MAG: hypothetical protein DIU69_02620 [Bacillota bacterium]